MHRMTNCPMHTATPCRDADRAVRGCVLALACLTLFTLVIWAGCALAWHSARGTAAQVAARQEAPR